MRGEKYIIPAIAFAGSAAMLFSREAHADQTPTALPLPTPTPIPEMQTTIPSTPTPESSPALTMIDGQECEVRLAWGEPGTEATMAFITGSPNVCEYRMVLEQVTGSFDEIFDDSIEPVRVRGWIFSDGEIQEFGDENSSEEVKKFENPIGINKDSENTDYTLTIALIATALGVGATHTALKAARRSELIDLDEEEWEE